MKPIQSNSSLDELPTSSSPNKKGLRPRSKLWLFIWLAFALQITAWVFWVKLASKHPVQEVPLVTAQPTPPPTPGENLSPGQAANERPAQ